METNTLLWPAAKAFLIALTLTPIFRDVFRSYNVVDRPGRRKVHAHPIPRIGGIPIAIAYGYSLIGFIPTMDTLVWDLLPGVSVIFLTGLLDDLMNLRPVTKLMGQILAACLVYFNAGSIEGIAGSLIPPWLSFPLTICWLLLSTNALNLIDGLDGLCAGMGLMATLTLFSAATIQGNLPLQQVTLCLAGALLGFLCYNFNPATVFLGDSGALLIGFLLGCYGMIWTQKSATLVGITVPLLAMCIPLLDVSLSIVRRMLKNQPIFSADRGHIHHRLLDRGLTVRQAVLTLYLVTAAAAAIAVLFIHPALRLYQGPGIILFLFLVWAGIGKLRYAEFTVASKLLFGGEFQRTLQGRVRVSQLAGTLQKCTSEQERWMALVLAAREAGWYRIAWINGSVVHEDNLVRQKSTWSFTVAISESERIEIEGALPFAPGSMELAAFADAVAGNLSQVPRTLPALP